MMKTTLRIENLNLIGQIYHDNREIVNSILNDYQSTKWVCTLIELITVYASMN